MSLRQAKDRGDSIKTDYIHNIPKLWRWLVPLTKELEM